MGAHEQTPSGLPRARALGIPLAGTPGEVNAITDVPGLELGYATLIEGTDVRTGVTAIHPRGRAGAVDPWVAGVHNQNGNGEMTGLAWIAETGTAAGLWQLPVVSETWDGYLHDINGAHVTEAHAIAALDGAASGPVEEGSVGGGTGMNCYDFKGGSGTASRLVGFAGATYAVGVFVQANFGDRRELTIAGVPLGEALADDDPLGEFFAPPGAGSIVAIVATDAPLLPGQCAALARRVTTGIARTGTTGSHFSGDLFLALSTGNRGAFAPRQEPATLDFVPWGALDPFFAAVVHATEEAILNALVANEEMIGFQGHRSPALPRERVRELVVR
jgi:L-aminopeptidase/D-esterase-like protein